ncbi:YqaJ viral recombinase family protein [Acidithiobacillus sp. IBUN Pt1247-S3]|uniref:YqaJ viral recombinase family nuclease n=1 Tax=Acidithiobacillus sp. IBUN Pt1247-S3 TaxID=3166642 RepID=UPI0034E56DF8
MSALRLVSTRDMPREEWLQWRRQGIGSSDAAAAVGLSPYQSPLALWLEKTGQVEPEDLSSKEAVYWGTLLEPLIAQAYSERTGKKVRRVQAVLQHPQYPFMLANLDRQIEGGGILEIKTAGLRSEKLWAESVPLHYQMQVFHQLAVTGKAWAEVAVLLGGQELRIYRLEPTQEQLKTLVTQEQAFWQHVEGNTPPEVDGSESCNRALAALYPQSSSILVDYQDREDMNRLFGKLLRARKTAKAAEQTESLLEQRVKEAIGTAEGAIFATGKALWKSTQPRKFLDTTALQQHHPELLAPYWVEKPGSRRFTVQEGE